MTTKRMPNALRFGILALALTLMTTCLLGGTLAKYTTDVTGTGSAMVAKWSFKANGGTQTFTVDLAKTAYNNIDNTDGNKIAPGTEGSFDIVVDATGSETALDYAIEFSGLTNMPSGLKFYTDEAHNSGISDLSTYKDFKGTIALADVGAKVTKTVYWDWPYEATGSADSVKNANDVDTALGGNADATARNIAFDITVTGTQVQPEAPTV